MIMVVTSMVLAVRYEQELGSGKKPAAMPEHDYRAFLAVHADYRRAVADAMAPEAAREAGLEFAPLPKDALSELMDANGWTVEQYFLLEDALCEKES